MQPTPSTAWPGRHDPLGATWHEEATNFAVWAPQATGVQLCLYDGPGDTPCDRPGDKYSAESHFDLTEHTLGIWHGAVPGVPVGARYGFRVDGPREPERGLRFDPATLLIDPYARAVAGSVASGDAASVVVRDEFDWGEDTQVRPRVAWSDTVLYELHVKGFTKLHPGVPEPLRGTYAGLATPAVVDYLRDLGVTTVELLPVHQFADEPRLVAHGLTNYWGYNTLGFFAPHNAYSASGDRGQQVAEFKAMVKALHEAGLEVVLDVVFNHTAEGPADGPTLSLRGLDDRGYYKRVRADEDEYFDVTGCGNTLDAGDPAALRMILDSLRYWVDAMHVDGFRFDLAPALTRTGTAVDMDSHLLATIGQDPVLRRVKLIAEPWDASPDGHLLGRFPPPWVEWNDRYRDTVRDFWRGHSPGTADVASRLAGSSDLYADDGRSPCASVNFVTAHDGFTLRDLVSYDRKHNEANREGNRDGADHNRSWNCGVEGDTDDPGVVALRHRQAANLLLTLCLSAGVPMLVAGDERGRTQRGNNNAYCQDNEISWLDWQDDDWLDLHRTVRAALRLRREHPALRQRHYLAGEPARAGGPKDLVWVHPDGREMTDDDWADPGLQTMGMLVSGDPLRAPGPRGEQVRDASFLLWLHADAEPGKVALPSDHWPGPGEVVLSTDAGRPVGERLSAGRRIDVGARSVVVLRQIS
ncbi:MAG TPA: glycogen debranching protein GlgX [Nocardioidaceae bacterium]|nr:glycogen debranching protein GlgX [Nocardioidaceae bacterium]